MALVSCFTLRVQASSSRARHHQRRSTFSFPSSHSWEPKHAQPRSSNSPTSSSPSRLFGDQLPSAVHRDGHRHRGPDQASTLLSGYSMPTFLMSALKRGSGRRGSKMGEGATNGSHAEGSW